MVKRKGKEEQRVDERKLGVRKRGQMNESGEDDSGAAKEKRDY